MENQSKSNRKETFVSVIIPTYNRKKMVQKCLESILNQDFSGSYEIITVDDGSTDGTDKLIKKMEKENSKIKYMHQMNRGPAAARNLGIENSNRDIIAFIDDDCIAEKDWLRHIVERFSIGAVNCVAGEIKGTIKTNSLIERYSNIYSKSGKISVKHNFADTANAAFRRDVFHDIGLFDTELPPVEDADLGWRLTSSGYKIEYVADMIVYHKHRTSVFGLFKQHFHYGKNEVLLYKKHWDYITEKKRINIGFWLHLPFFLILLFYNLLTSLRKKDKMLYISTPLFHCIRISGSLFGRLAGSIKYRFLYL